MAFLFEIKFKDTADMLWFYAQIFVLIFLAIYLVMMIQSAKKSEIQSQKEMFGGFAGFILANCLNQLIFLVHTIWDRQGRELFPRVIRIGGTGYEYQMLIWFAIAFMFLMKPIEKYVLQREVLKITKLNYLSLILLIIPYIGALIHYSIVGSDGFNAETPYNYWTFIAYLGVVSFGFSAIFSMFGSFYFYIRLGLSATGALRKKGFLLGFGILFMYIGIIVGSNFSGYLGVAIGPGIMVIGGIMVIIGHRITME